jgi:phosphopantothenoylcysteine decarboxylase/phosphopantothenate--cysteine ligase
MAEKKSSLADINILLGVTGGVAAYKAVDLASRLTAAGAVVKTAMTQNACQLIQPKSFEAVTNSAVYTTLWSTSEEYKSTHISLVEWADIVVITPATANIIAKVANGICDDLVSTILCVCWQKPTFLAPAMNDRMWENPAVQRNVDAVRKMGFKIIGPEHGRLACGAEGFGRMVEPQEILELIETIAAELKRNRR